MVGDSPLMGRIVVGLESPVDSDLFPAFAPSHVAYATLPDHVRPIVAAGSIDVAVGRRFGDSGLVVVPPDLPNLAVGSVTTALTQCFRCQFSIVLQQCVQLLFIVLNRGLMFF